MMTVQAELRPFHLECVSHLTMLSARVREMSAETLWAEEVEHATRAVLDAAQAAQDIVLAELADPSRRPATTRFLSARMARLRIAADAVLAAAEDGDIPALRRHLRTFTAISEAICTVQQSFLNTMAADAPLPYSR